MENNSDLDFSNYSTSASADVLLETLLEFKTSWDILLGVYKPLEVIVLFIGLLGNILALATLARSSKMCTPSFVYHRVLVGADLAFCINFFLNEIAERWLTVNAEDCLNKEQVQFVFRYWAAAFYSGIMYFAVNNICGYVILYMTLIIALDRTLALIWFKSYHFWNHRQVAWSMVSVSFVLSAGLHSWTCFVEKVVMTHRLNLDEYPLHIKPCWNESVVYQWVNRENLSDIYVKAAKARNAYNGAIRIVYPVCLSLLTIAVFYGLVKRQRRRRRTRARTTAFFSTAETSVMTDTNSLAFSTAACNSPTNTIRSRFRAKVICERVLFFLMVAVVVLAFIQVSASETKRVLQLLFPPDVLLRESVANQALPMDKRLSDFKLVLYGHQIVKLVSNFCTVIDRSFICILYMAMNKLFRREALALLKRVYRRCSNGGLSLFRWKPKRSEFNEIDETSNVNALGLIVRCSDNAYLRVPSSPGYSCTASSSDRPMLAQQGV